MTVDPDLLPERGSPGGLHRAGRPDAAPGRRRPLADGARPSPTWPRPWAGGPTWSTAPDFTARRRRRTRSIVVVATQGHGDEEAVEQAVARDPGVRRAGRLPQARRGRARLPRRPRRAAEPARPGAGAGRARPRPHLAPRDRGRDPRRAGAAAGRRRARAGDASRGQRRAGRGVGDRGDRPGLRDDGARPTRRSHPVEHDGIDVLLLLRRLPRRVRAGPARYLTSRAGGLMLIKNDFEVAQPVDKVWEFFDDIPQVAACLPGAELTDDLGDDKYLGKVGDPDGPGQAAVRRQGRRSSSATTPPSGSSSTRPAPTRRAAARPRCWSPRRWRRPRSGTKVDVDQDLQLSGAAAQYGRGMISDVTAVLMRRLRRPTCSTRIDAHRAGESVADQVGRRAGQRLRHRPAGDADGADAGVPPVLPALPTQPELRRTPHGAVVDRQRRPAAGRRARAGRAAQPRAGRAGADPRRVRRHPGRRRSP